MTCTEIIQRNENITLHDTQAGNIVEGTSKSTVIIFIQCYSFLVKSYLPLLSYQILARRLKFTWHKQMYNL
jgi:hypothetical protein